MSARRILLSVAVPLLPALVAFACGGGNENLPPPPPPPAPPPAEATPAASAAPSASVETPPAPPPAPPPALVQGTPSPDPPPPAPTVKFLAPAANQVIPAAKAGDFEVKVDVKNWKTAQGDAHVHLILDDKPYKPLYDTKAPVKLSELPGGDALAPGQHILVAFPSRANHESVKTPGAVAVLQFWIDKKGDVTQDVKKPMLVYSRPKGEYKGDMANHVLVDFYLLNEKLSQGGDHVHIAVSGPGTPNDGLTADATQWGPPFFLDNLQDGSYQVKLDLQDKDGKTVPGAWNTVTRTINVTHQAQ